MNFEYNEQQQQLADAVSRYIAKEYDFDARSRIVKSDTGASDDVWQTFAELGLLALPFAEEHGGFGGGAVDLMPVMEAIGDGLVVEPYLSTIGLAAQFIARFGSDAQKSELLPAVGEGSLKLAFAHTERAMRHRPQRVALAAKRVDGGWALNGEKTMVVHGPLADKLVVSARTDGAVGDDHGLSLLLVDANAPGITMRRFRSVDEMAAADIVFSNVKVGADALIGAAGEALSAIEEVHDFASALICAEAVGAIAYANAQTLEYLKTRRQYGKTLGSFQVLQHRMVEMMISHEQAKSMACLACVKVDTETDARERRRIVSAARIRVGEACRQIAQESVQMHGGIGMTEELKLSHTFRRLMVIERQFGDIDYHLERYAQMDQKPVLV